MNDETSAKLKDDLARGDFTGVITDCDRRVKGAPDDADAYMLRGLARLLWNKPRRAIRDFSAGLAKLRPELPVRFHREIGLGDLPVRRQAGESVFSLDDALPPAPARPQISPRAAALNNRGVARFHKGSVGAAIADFEASVKADPGRTVLEENLLRAGMVKHQSRLTRRGILLLCLILPLLLALLYPEDPNPGRDVLLLMIPPLLLWAIIVRLLRWLGRDHLRLIGWNDGPRRVDPQTGAILLRGLLNPGKILRSLLLLSLVGIVVLLWRIGLKSLEAAAIAAVCGGAGCYFLWSALRARHLEIILRHGGLAISGQLLPWKSIRRVVEKSTFGHMKGAVVRRIRILAIEAQTSVSISDEALSCVDYETLVSTLGRVTTIERTTRHETS